MFLGDLKGYRSPKRLDAEPEAPSGEEVLQDVSRLLVGNPGVGQRGFREGDLVRIARFEHRDRLGFPGFRRWLRDQGDPAIGTREETLPVLTTAFRAIHGEALLSGGLERRLQI
jgi:hypothetical protein